MSIWYILATVLGESFIKQVIKGCWKYYRALVVEQDYGYALIILLPGIEWIMAKKKTASDKQANKITRRIHCRERVIISVIFLCLINIY